MRNNGIIFAFVLAYVAYA